MLEFSIGLPCIYHTFINHFPCISVWIMYGVMHVSHVVFLQLLMCSMRAVDITASWAFGPAIVWPPCLQSSPGLQKRTERPASEDTSH